jgi:FkbM family methyltransferase
MSRLRSILLPASGDPKEIIKTLRPTVAARKLAWRRDWLLFGRAVHARERPALTRLGSGYGGWVVPEDLIEGDWVVYSAGIGTDTSFDEALIARFGTDVFGFDPIDTAASHAREVVARQPRFHFRQVAVWSEDGEIDLFAPEDESHTSFSISDMQHTDRAVRTPARRLSTLMDELGHDRIDLLKLDVEGAEYAVLDDLLKGGLRPPVLCVEYHRTTTMEHMIGGVRRAEAAGYRVVHVHRSDVTFVHVDRF